MVFGMFCLGLANGIAYSGRRLLDHWREEHQRKKRSALAVGLPVPNFPLYQITAAVCIGLVILELIIFGLTLCITDTGTKR